MKKVVLILFVFVLTFSSCMVTKTSVGEFREAPGNEYTYAKGKQVWLFWGIFPLGRTNVNTPKNGICQVSTRYNFGDFLVSTLTCGLISSYTIKVTAKKQENNTGNVPASNNINNIQIINTNNSN